MRLKSLRNRNLSRQMFLFSQKSRAGIMNCLLNNNKGHITITERNNRPITHQISYK